jgi:hypothetical protein
MPVIPQFDIFLVHSLSSHSLFQVNIYLSDKRVTDVDSLDLLLVDFLGLEQLRLDMEATRDELVEALMGQHIQYDDQQQGVGEWRW